MKIENHFMVSQWIPKMQLKRAISKTLRTHWAKHMLFRKRLPEELGRGGEVAITFSSRQISFRWVPIEWGYCLWMLRQRHTQCPRRCIGGCGSSKQPIQSSLDHAFGVCGSSFRYRYTDPTRDQDGGGVVKEHYLKWYFEHIRIYLSPMEGVLILMPQELERR